MSIGGAMKRNSSRVFQIIPGLNAGRNEPLGWGENDEKGGQKSIELLREILVLVVGVILILWILFSSSGQSEGTITFGDRQVIETPERIIVPVISGGAARDNAKKAPGDRQVTTGNIAQVDAGKDNAYLYVGSNSPEVVVVTVLDDTHYTSDYLAKIVEDRIEYANAHDYGVYMRYAKDFKKPIAESSSVSSTWARGAVLREAMASFPKSKYFWFLDESGIVMNPLVDIVKEFVKPENLEPKMLRKKRVVRNSDYVHTLKFNKAEDVRMILTRDSVGITPLSGIFHNSLVSHCILEQWLQPLYRSYKGFNIDLDAWRHLFQWHHHCLDRVAMVPPKLLGSYASVADEELSKELEYTDGDFVVYFDCDYTTEACKQQFQRYWNGRGHINVPTRAPADEVAKA